VSSPRTDPPTSVIPAQAGRPAVPGASPAPPGNPWWRRRVPSKLGRARTSTVVIGVAWLVMFGLNVSLPQPNTKIITDPDTGAQYRVHVSTPQVPATTTPVRTAVPTTTGRATPTPTATSTRTSTAPTTRAPSTSDDETTSTPTGTRTTDAPTRTSDSAPTTDGQRTTDTPTTSAGGTAGTGSGSGAGTGSGSSATATPTG